MRKSGDLIPDTNTIPLILSINENEWHKNKELLSYIHDKIAYLIIKESENSIGLILDLTTQFPVLIALESQTDITALLETFNVNGIALNGSIEIKPGLKDYDHLADIFEQLELD
jgi:phosphoribosylanthranilate isomerase